MDFIKNKNVCAKDTINIEKMTHRMEENICKLYI